MALTDPVRHLGGARGGQFDPVDGARRVVLDGDACCEALVLVADQVRLYLKRRGLRSSIAVVIGLVFGRLQVLKTRFIELTVAPVTGGTGAPVAPWTTNRVCW